MSTQDDDLRLEPPEGARPPAPAPTPAEPSPPAEAGLPAEQQAPRPPAEQRQESELEPGRGRPLVEGPPMSVDEPVPESTVNRTAAFAGIGLLGLGLLVAVVLLLVIVFAICR